MSELINLSEEFSLMSVALRMILAVFCGGIIGLEREYKRRPAGFRTHILICLGAAITTLTSQYLAFTMGYTVDITRMGAQVVAGIGFIGAGSIIVSQRQRVKGLTTAAGLWTSAVIGLCLGMGFYLGAVIASLLILLAELLFSKLEYWVLNHAPEIHLYVEYRNKCSLEKVLELYRKNQIKVLSMEITRSSGDEAHNACAIFHIRLDKHIKAELLLENLEKLEGILTVQEL